MKKITQTFIFFCYFLAPLCHAEAPDPLTGVRISLLEVQTALSQAPIPDLHETKKGSAKVAASYLTANINDTENQPFTLISKGTFNGGGLGFGYTSHTRHGFGLFILATSNYVVGNLQMNGNGQILNLANMKNLGLGTAAGVSLRLWQTKALDFSGGIFGGPTFSYFSSSFDTQDQNGNTVGGGTYTSKPITYGVMGGAQIGFNLLGFYFNPYAMYYMDLSDGCRSFSTSISLGPNAPPGQCSEGPYYIKLALSYFVYGINIGFKQVFVTVYSHVNKDSSMNSINLQAYQFSYRFEF